MRYATIKKNDVVDGVGITTSLWTQGCLFRCEGCHNPDTWDYNNGKEFTKETEEEIINALTKNGIKRAYSILGGEPLSPVNRKELYEHILNVRKAVPNLIIFLWTGYTWEDIKDLELIKEVDYLIEGPFVLTEKDLTLFLRGSRNQRLIDVKKTFLKNELTFFDKK